MKNICFYFQVHQPFRLRTYRFFDIGHDHYYYDDFLNRSVMQRVANNCYLPVNQLMLEKIKELNGQFKIAYSISGSALDQFEMYAPEVIDSFKALADTGCVEFLCETYGHTLASVKHFDDFERQVKQQAERIETLFGKKPTVFRNTELVYSDYIGEKVHQMGFKAMLAEGAKHVLGWKSPDYVYCNSLEPKLKLLLRNYKLSDDIAFRFSNSSWNEWPLTAQKFTSWVNNIEGDSEVVNLFMDYETFGEHQWEGTGIFDFLKALPAEILKNDQLCFSTPSEVVDKLQPVAHLNVPYPSSWADEERDLTAWLGNDLQNDAFNSLYRLVDKVAACTDESVKKDWDRLQTSDHFYYMCTKFFADGDVHNYFNPYNSPYEAFINFMNVLSDFEDRLTNVSAASTPEQLDEEIKEFEEKLKALKAQKKEQAKPKRTTTSKTTAKKSTTKTATTKKTTTAKKTTTRKTTTKAKTKSATADKASDSKKKNEINEEVGV